MPICARPGRKPSRPTNRRPSAASSFAIGRSTSRSREAISEIFSEVIIAPDFDAEARTLFQKKKNLRLIRNLPSSRKPAAGAATSAPSAAGCSCRTRIAGEVVDLATKVVTKRKPTEEELAAMIFGWRVVKHVKSNAIVYAASDRTLGIGAGQMSRVDASRIAVWKASRSRLSLYGQRGRERRLFPFSRWLDRRRGGRRDRGDSARRFGAR